MQYVLDTNICIALIRQRPAAILNQITRHTIMDIGISTLTIAELQYGVDKSSKPQHNQQALDQFLIPFTILDFDEAAAHAYGPIRTALEAHGTPIGSIDMLLAAQAIAHTLILVTNNTREFARIPNLRIEDWTQP